MARSDLLTVLAGGDLASDGAVRRAEIDAAEEQAYEHARREVYVGFHELEALLPGYVAPSRYPELVALHEPAGPATLPPIPPDLAAALGPAACDEMKAQIQADGVVTKVSTHRTATSGGRSTSLPSSTTCGASATPLVCRPARQTRQ